MKVKCNLIIDEILANAIFVNGREILQNKILMAYAAHKYSMFKNNGKLYSATEIIHSCIKTNRNLPPHKISISFEAIMRVGQNTDQNLICKNTHFVEERECRRHVDIAHPLIQAHLAPLGELSMQYISRVLEMRIGDYRLIIEPQQNRYFIQYKKFRDKKVVFRLDSLTLEFVYISDEGESFYDAQYIQHNSSDDSSGESMLVGMASFLDGSDLCIKTTYLLDYSTKTVLYHRYIPNDHTQIFPFTLETEDLQQSETGPALTMNTEGVPTISPPSGTSIYWYTSWRLEAQLPLNLSMYQHVHEDSTPHHPTPSESLNQSPVYIFPKLDGNNGILRFYPSHFVISNPLMLSTSHPHLIPQHILHSLIDFIFTVETDLYSINNNSSSFMVHNYRPVAIIDIVSTAFNAAERMNILQVLRAHFRNDLAPYYIFFQGELSISKPSISPSLPFENFHDGEIYEVLLNNNRNIIKVCRHRPDKSRANPLKTVNIILGIQKLEESFLEV